MEAAMSDLFNWRAHLKVHPAAEAFPPLEGIELKELSHDIKANGMREALTFWRPEPDSQDISLLDGVNRLNALALANWLTVNSDGQLCLRFFDGKEFVIRPIRYRFREGDPYKLVASLNAHRRHLKPETKREIIARLLKASRGNQIAQLPQNLA
jgi:hypothetical protein